ncbi:MAG: SpoIID/LytB domain-containing protein [Pyrinomonadaceae bacterium]
MSTSSFHSTKFIALSIVYALLAQPAMWAQTTSTQSRPRRVQTEGWTNPPAQPSRPEVALTPLEAEPTIRIGLSTNARSATISTAGQGLSVERDQSGEISAPITLSVARVRIEPRLLMPLPVPRQDENELFRVEIATVTSQAQADSIAREVRELTNEALEVAREANTATWRVRVGAPANRPEEEEPRSRPEEAGIAAVSLVNAQAAVPHNSREAGNRTPSNGQRPTTLAPNRTSATHARQSPVETTATAGRQQPAATQKHNSLRLAARASLPARGLVVYAAGTSPLLDSRAPITFSPVETKVPLRFNEKPYRGRLEVFTNLNGSLTVVNVLGLEDYVRGVVPNELSPGGYGALEALKAQAVAARTYAVSNRGQFIAAGFDLLPTIRSQVYGGLSTEHPLSTRAVEETRGIIATFHGEPINALYTSTCGGRTEHAENIFGGNPVSYLRGRDCTKHASPAAHASFVPNIIRTTRELNNLRAAEHAASARDLSLLAVHGFRPPARLSDDWLAANVSTEEVRALLETAARLARRPAPPSVNAEATRPPAFSTALALALDGESRADVLLAQDDVTYLLAFRDAEDIPAPNRADVAMLLRDGHLTLHTDATLRPRQPLTRARALHTVAHLLEARGFFNLQKATARPSIGGTLVVRAGKAPERAFTVAADAYLFRAFGENLFPVRDINVAGGEPIAYHTDARGAVDYLESYPPPKGASAENVSPFTSWTTTLSVGEVAARLARRAGRIGSLVDLRVVARGVSRRVLDLEVIGTNGTAHVRGGRIRSALGLREQLFVIDRKYDENGRLTNFVFTGRGWGHGVGMCQVGAYGMARANLTYDRILKNYYTGIDLTKMY